jgi:hypothetical protein
VLQDTTAAALSGKTRPLMAPTVIKAAEAAGASVFAVVELMREGVVAGGASEASLTSQRSRGVV